MRHALTLTLGILALTMVFGERSATSRSPASKEGSSQHTCRLVTGYGTAIGRGPSKLKAKEAAMEICGGKLIDDYYARRGKIEPDAELELACINLECS